MEMIECHWCDNPAMGYASYDPEYYVWNPSCGSEDHGVEFHLDSTIFDDWLEHHERIIAAQAWDEGFAAQGEASFDSEGRLITDVKNPYTGEQVFG